MVWKCIFKNITSKAITAIIIISVVSYWGELFEISTGNDLSKQKIYKLYYNFNENHKRITQYTEHLNET